MAPIVMGVQMPCRDPQKAAGLPSEIDGQQPKTSGRAEMFNITNAERLSDDIHMIAKAFERIGLAAESVALDIRKRRELAEKEEPE
jgi:hypothetical protein